MLNRASLKPHEHLGGPTAHVQFATTPSFKMRKEFGGGGNPPLEAINSFCLIVQLAVNVGLQNHNRSDWGGETMGKSPD